MDADGRAVAGHRAGGCRGPAVRPGREAVMAGRDAVLAFAEFSAGVAAGADGFRSDGSSAFVFRDPARLDALLRRLALRAAVALGPVRRTFRPGHLPLGPRPGRDVLPWRKRRGAIPLGGPVGIGSGRDQPVPHSRGASGSTVHAGDSVGHRQHVAVATGVAGANAAQDGDRLAAVRSVGFGLPVHAPSGPVFGVGSRLVRRRGPVPDPAIRCCRSRGAGAVVPPWRVVGRWWPRPW
jgi:hypothetical protein